MANRRFEDFEVGREIQHAPGRTVLDADNTWFTLLTMNQHPLHFDAEYDRGPRVHIAVGAGDRCREGRNQDGVVVIEFERTVLIPKREAADVPA